MFYVKCILLFVLLIEIQEQYISTKMKQLGHHGYKYKVNFGMYNMQV